MAATFPNKTIFSVFTTLAAAKVISEISNASPGVATSTAHGYSNGGILLLSMPSLLDQRVARVAGQTTNAFNLEGFDTTSTTRYPAGFGLGSAQLASNPVPLNQVTDAQTSGGEQQFYQWTYLEDGRQRQRPTFKNARSLQLTLDWDPNLAWHGALLAADESSNVYVLQAALPNGNKLYYSVYVGFDGEPSFTINENMKTVATFALANPQSTRYSA